MQQPGNLSYDERLIKAQTLDQPEVWEKTLSVPGGITQHTPGRSSQGEPHSPDVEELQKLNSGEEIKSRRRSDVVSAWKETFLLPPARVWSESLWSVFDLTEKKTNNSAGEIQTKYFLPVCSPQPPECVCLHACVLCANSFFATHTWSREQTNRHGSEQRREKKYFSALLMAPDPKYQTFTWCWDRSLSTEASMFYFSSSVGINQTLCTENNYLTCKTDYLSKETQDGRHRSSTSWNTTGDNFWCGSSWGLTWDHVLFFLGWIKMTTHFLSWNSLK